MADILEAGGEKEGPKSPRRVQGKDGLASGSGRVAVGGAGVCGKEQELTPGLVKFEILVRHCGRQRNGP